MDIELLRTFLSVTQARHFGKAADSLFLTPAAVSARIRQLEQLLGVSLFHRTRGNIQMTSAGEKLLPHAKKMLEAWVEAQIDLAVKLQPVPQLKIGCPSGLWYLLKDLLDTLSQREHLALSLESRTTAELLNQLTHQHLDLALLLELPVQQDITSIQISELQLGLFTSPPENSTPTKVNATYIQLDWGIGFANKLLWQEGSKPQQILRSNDLHVALDLLQQLPACVHLPIPNPLENSLLLHQEISAPAIVLPTYLAYRANSEHAALLKVLLADSQIGFAKGKE